MYKNRLQEFVQRSSISFPEFLTTNEGSQHAPKFRTTKKAAEQDATKIVLKSLKKKIKNDKCPLVVKI
ncbi:hypothetical protein AHAS_Ahas04G0198600 [Arachis hypogaea]